VGWAKWWQAIREVVTFALGVAVIVDSFFTHDRSVGELVVGLVMIGVLPLDRLLGAIGRRADKDPRQ
jgi:hypothetical protein